MKGLQAAGRDTLPKQIHHFESVLPDFKGCHPATINLRLDRELRIENPDYETRFEWTGPPGEVFGFLKIGLEFPVGAPLQPAWIYIPHDSPHFGIHSQAEVISQKIEGISYGSLCRVHILRGRLESEVLIV